jgi:hypothetical protein
MPIFVAPIKCNNFKWVKSKTWTLYQTACILSGIEPFPESKLLYEDTSNILDFLAAAIEAETLLPVGNYHGDVKFYPLEIIAWAKTIGMEISEEFTVIALLHSETRPVEYPRNPDTKKTKDRAQRVIKGLKNNSRLIRLPQGVNSLRQQPIGGCKNFCVNGQMAGNCRAPRSEDDRSKESRPQRVDCQLAG